MFRIFAAIFAFVLLFGPGPAVGFEVFQDPTDTGTNPGTPRLIPTDGSPEVKVSSVSRNGTTQSSFLNPALPAGTYWLEVRARVRFASDLRAGRLKSALTVA